MQILQTSGRMEKEVAGNPVSRKDWSRNSLVWEFACADENEKRSLSPKETRSWARSLIMWENYVLVVPTRSLIMLDGGLVVCTVFIYGSTAHTIYVTMYIEETKTTMADCRS